MGKAIQILKIGAMCAEIIVGVTIAVDFVNNLLNKRAQKSTQECTSTNETATPTN